MGARVPGAARSSATSSRKWLESEEESFGRTLEQGLKRLDELIERARDDGAEGIAAADAFLLHDTYGFPIDLTLEIVAEHGLGVDEEGFEALMEDQRAAGARERAAATRGGEELRERALALAGQAGFATEFVGYETTDARDHDRRRGDGRRHGAGQARRVAVLRHRRRPGGRLGLRRVR